MIRQTALLFPLEHFFTMGQKFQIYPTGRRYPGSLQKYTCIVIDIINFLIIVFDAGQ